MSEIAGIADRIVGGVDPAPLVDEFADVHLAFVEECADDAQPGLVAEHAESFGHVFEQFGWKCLGHD